MKVLNSLEFLAITTLSTTAYKVLFIVLGVVDEQEEPLVAFLDGYHVKNVNGVNVQIGSEKLIERYDVIISIPNVGTVHYVLLGFDACVTQATYNILVRGMMVVSTFQGSRANCENYRC